MIDARYTGTFKTMTDLPLAKNLSDSANLLSMGPTWLNVKEREINGPWIDNLKNRTISFTPNFLPVRKHNYIHWEFPYTATLTLKM